MKTKVAVLFGGVSAEHEVSVITGLQVIENIDCDKFKVYPIKLSNNGFFYYYPHLTNRKKYLSIKPKKIVFNKDEKGFFFVEEGIIKIKTYLDVCYLAFHGGNGESGQIQGFLDMMDIAYTSPSLETSAITMNKALTKEVLEHNKIKTVPWTRLFSENIKNDLLNSINKVIKELTLPVIIKPVHYGSSIAINIAKTKVELKKYLLEASFVDSEILIEKFISGFREFNISVRKIGEKILTSEIEEPVSKDQILSFADKYQRGGKKTEGMASLMRNLPAKIPLSLKNKLQNLAIAVYESIRADNLIRVDFMVKNSDIYIIEVNPIPGSMSFFLWEASGISFKEQITDTINQAISNYETKVSNKLIYKTDIIEKFVSP